MIDIPENVIERVDKLLDECADVGRDLEIARSVCQLVIEELGLREEYHEYTIENMGTCMPEDAMEMRYVTDWRPVEEDPRT